MIQKRSSAYALLAMAALTCTSGMAIAQISNGADVIVGDLPSAANNTPNTTTDVGFDAFAIGTTSCNRGNTELLWYSGTNQHPVIGQNLFRLHNGRFEQIGQAWLKHGFTALQGTECAGDPGFPHAGCANSGTGSRLGVGCSDPYSSGLNNGQSGLGPKWQVNAAKGVFPYPYASPAFTGQVARRLRVRVTDLNPATYSGAQYFVEGQYVVPDDAGYGNANNSASYRPATIAPIAGSPTPPVDFNMTTTGTTVREQPAIYAWQVADPTVQITTADIVNDGRFILACKVSGPVSGVYTYEYALHNLTSDRCAGSFSVPYPSGTAISSVGFKDVDYFDGELNQTPANPASDDWTSSVGATNVTWSGVAYSGSPATYAITGANTSDFTQSFRLTSWTQGTGNDHTANVLRWGTLFNFRFQTTVAPAAGRVGVGLWRPGTLTSFTMNIQTPGGAAFGTASTGPCCNGTTCTLTTQAACTGVFGAVGGTCSPNPCVTPTGACCTTTGACTVTTQTGCTSSWTSGGACSPNPCSQPGACCDSLGVCTSVIQSSCTGAFTAGGVCSPNPCPQPSGACCVGTNCSVTSPSACTGTYIGNNTACATGICASNDLCGGATPLCAGIAANGNNSSAVTNTTVTCTTSNKEVWFKYTPATSGSISIAVNSVTGTTMTDSVLAVFSACSGGTQLACDDDSGPGLFSLISALTVTAGTDYFISVGSFGSTAGGTFTITVTGGGGTGCNPPSGVCCNAGACTFVTQANCTTGTWTQGGSCSPNPCSVPSGSCCASDTSCSVTAQSACTGTWTSGGTCSPNLCPPSNDNCINRAGLGLGSQNFSTVNATTDGIAHNPGCLFFSNDNITNDIWFNHPSTNTGQLRIDTCGSSYDTKIAVYSGQGCDNLATRLIACDDDNPTVCGTGSTQSAVTINVTAGQHYTIRIGGYNGATGAGIVTLTFIPPATGACCAANGSCTVTTPAACSTTYQGDGSTCSPNPCPQPTGACCVGTTCSIVTQAACSGSWNSAVTTCGATGNPTTCCKANFNGVGGVSVQDIFDFLAAWFNNSPSADINGVGGVSVQDIFDFLALWFAGCPG